MAQIEPAVAPTAASLWKEVAVTPITGPGYGQDPSLVKPSVPWPLSLTADQRAGVQRLFDAMKAEAVPLGSRLIEQEADLDKQFASRTVTPESLKASTAAIATT